MALEELKELGQEILLVSRDDPQWPDQVQCLENVSTKYKTFARMLQTQLMRRPSNAQPLLMATLELEYNRSNITWLPDEASMDEADKRINYYRDHSYHGYAHILQIRRLMEYPHLASEELPRLIDCRQQFLDSVQSVLKIEDMKEAIPNLLLDSQLFLPRRILKISALMDHVTKIGLKDCLGRTTSHIAFDAGISDSWLETHIKDKDVLGRTAMHLVCQIGDDGLVSKYLSRLPALGSKTVIGTTPFHIAASKGYLNICLQMRDYLALNAMDIPVLEMNDGIVPAPLPYAVSHGHHGPPNFLSQNIFKEMEDCDNFGNTPLSLATRRGHVSLVRLLLASNCIVDKPDKQGRTAFWYAVHGSQYDMMTVLEPFTDTDQSDHEGRTPLLEAASQGFLEGLRFLLSLSDNTVSGQGKPRVNPYFMNKNFEASIQLAGASGNQECVRLLVEHFKKKETPEWYRENYAAVVADRPKLPFEWKKIFGSP
jgi:ankyrin repeat protein